MSMTLKSSDVKKCIIPWLKRLAAVSSKWFMYGDYVVDSCSIGCRNWASFPVNNLGSPVFPLAEHLLQINFDNTEMKNPIESIGEIKGKNTYSLALIGGDLILYISDIPHILATTVQDFQLIEKLGGDVFPDGLSSLLNRYPESWTLDAPSLQSFRGKGVITVTTPYRNGLTNRVRISKNKYPFVGTEVVARPAKYHITYAAGEFQMSEEATKNLHSSVAIQDGLIGLLLGTHFFGDLEFSGYSEHINIVY